MKLKSFNWKQTGMPVSLVSPRKGEFSEFKSVLNDAGGHVMRPVDAESMARELTQSGGREYVEMVRELTTALANKETELENANRRYERLVAELTKRGIRLDEDGLPVNRRKPKKVSPLDILKPQPKTSSPAQTEWDAWDRKFQSLLG